MTLEQRFVLDQLDAVADDLGRRMELLAKPRGILLTARDDAAGRLAAALLEALEGGLPLCEHLTAVPQLMSWTPGMPSIACFIDTTAFGFLNLGRAACDLCDRPVAQADLHSAQLPAGPVLIVGGLCPPCRHRPAARTESLRDVDRQVTDLIAARYEDAA